MIEQNLRVNDAVDKGTTVVLTVSKGPKTVQVRNFVGIDIRDARELAENDGLRVNTVSQYSNTTPEGIVIAQDCSYKSYVADGTTITLTVSAGQDVSSSTGSGGNGGTSGIGEGGAG